MPRLAHIAALLTAPAAALALGHPWPHSAVERLADRFAPPAGFARVPAPPDSYAAFLRELPLRPGRPAVHDFRGRVLPTQAHLAVVDLDVLPHQECADTAMRLRAEWLRASGRENEIRFHFTSGDLASWERWKQGVRPRVRGNRVSWARTAAPDGSARAFRDYLKTVFLYAGSLSLGREMERVDPARIAIGDVFLQGGSPGHVVIVVDLAEHPKTKERRFLLAQGFMPAQELHVLKGPDGESGWYPAAFGERLETPDWTFSSGDLYRFRE